MENESLVVSLILGIASIISSVMYGYLPSRRKEKIERLTHQRDLLFQDVKSFYVIEDKLVKQLAEAVGKNEVNIKKRVRQEVREETGHTLSDYTKPSKTSIR